MNHCSGIKEALVALFAKDLEVTSVDTACIITLPLKTADDRYIDVFVEPVESSQLVYVHDGGKSTAELFAQGIHPTDTQEAMLKGIAQAHGVVFQKGRFQVACPNEAAVQNAVFAIGQCVALAMIEVVSHEAVIEDEALSGRIARSLDRWRPSYVEIHRRYPVEGRMVQHLFDFVSMPIRRKKQTVALKILHPSIGPKIQAERYGFLAYDIRGKEANKWSKLAIVAKVEEWSETALRLVKDLSDDVILLNTDHEEYVENVLPSKMTELTDAA
jgi:hypothetical protein